MRCGNSLPVYSSFAAVVSIETPAAIHTHLGFHCRRMLDSGKRVSCTRLDGRLSSRAASVFPNHVERAVPGDMADRQRIRAIGSRFHVCLSRYV